MMNIQELYQKVKEAFPEARSVSAGIDTLDGITTYYRLQATTGDRFSNGKWLLSESMILEHNIDKFLSDARAKNPLSIIDPEEVLG